jgi:predicted flap endonuclease-1-like 5' DNA nuclease
MEGNMSAWAAFFLGLLIGWLIEWLIDLWYWRRRYHKLLRENRRLADLATKSKQDNEYVISLNEENKKLGMQAEGCASELKAKQAEIDQLTQDIGVLKARLGKPEIQAGPVMPAPESVSGIESKTAEVTLPRAQISTPVVIPDDLIIINGIGPRIAQLLNNAGIFTFEQLAAQTPQSLEALLGDVIRRLADEDSIIAQARELAEKKRQK